MFDQARMQPLQGCHGETKRKNAPLDSVAPLYEAPRWGRGPRSCKTAQEGKVVHLQAAWSLTHNVSVLVSTSGWMTEVAVSCVSAWTTACPLSPPGCFLLSLSQFFFPRPGPLTELALLGDAFITVGQKQTPVTDESFWLKVKAAKAFPCAHTTHPKG